jgi:hypothetical protein
MIRSPLRIKPDSAKLTVKVKTKKCAACPTRFVQFTSMVKWCSPECGYALSQLNIAKNAAAKAKAEAALTRSQLQELKPLHYWAKRAERACNAFIRLRDAGDPCISCGTYDAPEWHAGHCYTVGARPDIRFHEDNVHLQCPKCNTYQGGMVADYKVRIVSKIGQARLDALAYVNPAFKKTREYYQAIEADYKARLKQLKQEQGEA